MNTLSEVTGVTVAEADKGVEYWAALQQARDLKVTFLIFNGRMVDVYEADTGELFWDKYPIAPGYFSRTYFERLKVDG